MALLFWDASALAKRYFGEVGSDTVNALFASLSSQEMASTAWAYAETYSMLLRRLNAGSLTPVAFTTSVTSLQAEVVNDPGFGLLPIDDAAIFASIFLMRKHNLNATDAAILTMLLDYVQSLPPVSRICVLVAADRRLLRAADAEGLKTVNPETLAVADVPSLLAGL
jgi:predicted nucleic acid-binding protein